jgi:hypothetical protein
MTLLSVCRVVLGLLFLPNVATKGGLRDLVWSEDGRLVFSQLMMETREKLAPLYGVTVNLDIEEMDVANGMSMLFDKQANVMRLDPGLQPSDALAWGRYDDTIATNGWSSLFLDTSTSTSISNDVKMYAAGYLEGLMTCVRFSEYYANTHLLMMKTEEHYHALLNIKGMLKSEIGFVKMKSNIIPHIMTEEPEDPYFKHVRYLLFQMWGIADGYNFAATHFNVHTLGLEDMVLINSGGELPDLMQAYTPLAVSGRIAAQSPPGVFLQERMKHTRMKRARRGQPATANGRPEKDQQQRQGPKPSKGLRGGHVGANASAPEDPLDDAHWEKRLQQDGHCSAFVRLASNNDDLLVGHTTWDDYSEMTRIFKYYNFPLDASDTMAHLVAMSSYPGLVSSTDDYYLLSSGLAVMDTTLEILEEFIWDKVQDFPMTVHIPNFMHVMATNRMAKSPAQWAKIFQKVNTGTYNAQWMIVDYNQFTARQVLPDNTIWVLESIPGAVHTQDVSPIVRRQGYWASFNRPYFDDIRVASGHDAAQKSHGALYSFNDSPRGHIFATVAPTVETLMDMRGVMTRNDYPNAGVEPNEPGHEISARMDLSPTQPIPNGGIDAKVTNRCLFRTATAQAVSGPTHGNQPVFQWEKDDGSEAFPGYPHTGMPNIWNFDWVQMTPSSQGVITDIIDCAP